MDSINQPQNSSETSIFDDLKFRDEEQYKKVIKNARTSLFVIAGFQLVAAVAMAFMNEDEATRIAGIIIGVAIAATFTALGFYSQKKPYNALLTGLCVYCGLLILDLCFDPASVLKGIYMKIIIIAWLVNGIRKAKGLENIRRV